MLSDLVGELGQVLKLLSMNGYWRDTTARINGAVIEYYKREYASASKYILKQRASDPVSEVHILFGRLAEFLVYNGIQYLMARAV
jgi:hypothetical protein